MAASQSSTALLPSIGPFTTESALIASITSFSRRWMSSPTFDASHDWSHIQRVLALSLHLLSIQSKATAQAYNRTIIILAVLLHDIADSKYVQSLPRYLLPENFSTKRTGDLHLECLSKDVLEAHGADSDLAATVQEIINGMSYSTECSNPEHTLSVLNRHPELAIVQDADRLDALGAVGIARTFTRGGAVQGRTSKVGANDNQNAIGTASKGQAEKGTERRGLEGTINHFSEKLEKLGGMMKTTEGRRMATERTERLKVFKGWWEEEVRIVDAVKGESEIDGVLKGLDDDLRED